LLRWDLYRFGLTEWAFRLRINAGAERLVIARPLLVGSVLLLLGAAFAAYQDGRLVVDLWGRGSRIGTDRPWQQDTIQLMFSSTNGLV
jgi:hypothetical protein